VAETGKGNLTLSNACTALCSGGPYDLIAFWLIAVDYFCDLGAEVVDCFGLTYVGRASPDILQHVLSRAESE
jgi:hypothetical protein